MKLVSIILATYNEFDNLPGLLKRVSESANFDYEIIFVDDGSSDGTRDIILNYCENHNNSHYIFAEGKSGTAIARYRGILAANGEYKIIMDSDLQHPPEKLPELYDALEEGFDFAIFSRYLPDSSVGNRLPIRGLISRVAAFTAKCLLGEARQLSDPLSNFIGFKSTVIVPEIRTYGYEIPLAILSSNRKLRIRELPYAFHEREKGSSSVTSSLKFPLIFLREILTYTKISRMQKGRIEGRSEISEIQL